MKQAVYFSIAILICLGLVGCSFHQTQAISFLGVMNWQKATSNKASMTDVHANHQMEIPVTGQIDHNEISVESETERSVEPNCVDRVIADRVFDVTIPDDTPVPVEEKFIKIWRLVNGGSCTWTGEYSLQFFSGEDFSAIHSQTLSTSVKPGESVDIIVEMIAPDKVGVHWSNWKLQNPDGKTFGLGPDGDSPFWVKIQVVPAIEILQVTPSLNDEQIVLVQGTLGLGDGEVLDFETGGPGIAEHSDIQFSMENERYHFVLLNQTTAMIFGDNPPDLEDCQYAEMTTSALYLDEIRDGTFICARSSQGIPVSLRVIQRDEVTNTVLIEYLVWAVP